MTKLLFIKLLRDLRTIWDRILLMVFALSITLIMFSGVLYMWGITNREMPRAYLSTSPASATVLFKEGISAEEMADIVAAVSKQPGIRYSKKAGVGDLTQSKSSSHRRTTLCK